MPGFVAWAVKAGARYAKLARGVLCSLGFLLERSTWVTTASPDALTYANQPRIKRARHLDKHLVVQTVDARSKDDLGTTSAQAAKTLERPGEGLRPKPSRRAREGSIELKLVLNKAIDLSTNQLPN